MRIFIFGNPDIQKDALPITLLNELQAHFPEILFELKDPNEEIEASDELIIIDTVDGLNEIKTFDGTDNFVPPPQVTMHDLDLFSHLKLLKKIKKTARIKIIGVPPMIPKEKALDAIINEIEKLNR